MEKNREKIGKTLTKRAAGKSARRGRPPKNTVKPGGRKLDFILAKQLREMAEWNTTEVVRRVAEMTGRDLATIWRHIKKAREINAREDEADERYKQAAFDRVAVAMVQAQESEEAEEEGDILRKAQEVTIDGLWIFRPTAKPETVLAIFEVLKDIEKSIGRKLSARDIISIRQLADEYNTMIMARDDLEKEGTYIETARGMLMLHPAHKLKHISEANCFAIMKQYGLTMAARDRIKAFGGEDGGGPAGFDLGGDDFED